MARGSYSVSAQAQTISTAITILEITAPAAGVIFVTDAWLSAATVTAGTARLQLLRKTATVTGTASPPTPVCLDGTATSGVTIKWKATAEGTDGGIIREYNLRLDGGEVLYLPIPDKQVFVPPSGIIALKFPAAPTSSAYTFGIEYTEYV